MPSDFFIMIMAMLDFMLLQYNSSSFVYHQSVFRIFKVFKSLRALRAIRVLRRLRSAGPRLPTPPCRKGYRGLGSQGICCDLFKGWGTKRLWTPAHF